MVAMAVLTSGANNFCQDTFTSGAPTLLDSLVPGQPTVIRIGFKFSELSYFTAAATAIALSDGLGYPSELVPLFDESPSASNQVIIPADVSAVQGVSGLDLDDHLAAGGYRPELAGLGSDGQPYASLGSLGPSYRAGLYAPSYTVAALASTMSPLTPLPPNLGLPETLAARATVALLNTSNAFIIDGSVRVMELGRSVVARVLCVPGVHPVLQAGATGVEQLLMAANKLPPRTPTMLKALGLSGTMNCTDSFSSQGDMEAQLKMWVKGQQPPKDFIVLGWHPWSLAEELGLVRLPLPEYDAQTFMATRGSDFPTTAGVPKTAYQDAEAAYPPHIVNFLRSLYLDPAKTKEYLVAARRGTVSAVVNGTTMMVPMAEVNMSARADLAALLNVSATVALVPTPSMREEPISVAYLTNNPVPLPVLPTVNVTRYLIDEVPHLRNLTAAACLWLKEHQAQVLEWGVKVTVSFVSPKQGATSGYDVIRIVGTGFGVKAPLTAYASIGGESCLQTRWVDSTVLECVTPPGIGQNLDVSIQVGSQTAVLKRAFSYFPASVRAITSVAASTRQQNAGSPLYISGANFFNSGKLLCKFSGGTNGERNVPATFINFTALACTPPSTFGGALQVSVTNDGERYSSGLKLDDSAVRFPDGLSQAPPDFGPELAPSAMTIAFLIDTDLQQRERTAIFERIVKRTVNEIIEANKILPFTNISVVTYYVKSPPTSAPDQGDAGTAQQDEQYRQQMAELYLRIRKAHRDLVGFVGPERSVAAVPILQAMSDYSKTLGLPSPAMISYAATDPALSDPVKYPTFLRVVPSALTYARALAELLSKLQPKMIRNNVLPASASAPIVHVVVTEDDAPSVAAYDAFKTYLEVMGGGISRVTKIKTRDSAQLIAQAMQASGVATAAGAAITRLVYVAANTEASVRIIQAGGLVTDPGSMLGAAGGNARIWLGLQNLADAVIYSTGNVAVATIIALQASPGRSAVSTRLREESLNSVMGPFIHDAVGAYLQSIDTYIRNQALPELEKYTSIGLLELVRGAAHPEAVTGYVGFAPSSNDPQQAEFEIVNVLGLTPSQLPAFPTVEGVSQIMGIIVPGGALTLNSSVRAMLWNGPDPDYVPPSVVTVIVPFPIHPRLVEYSPFATSSTPGYGYEIPFDLQRDMVNYTLSWNMDLSGLAMGLPPVYMGLPLSYVNKTVDQDLINQLLGGKVSSATGGIFPYYSFDAPGTLVLPTPANPFTIVDPDDPFRPVGDQIKLFHPASLFWQTLEGLADDLNALSAGESPLRGAQVQLVALPYYLETGKGLANAHVNLAPTLHKALYTLHQNGSNPGYPNVIGVLGLHTDAGTKAVAEAIAAFPGPTSTLTNVDNAVLARLNKLPIVSYGATTSEFSNPALASTSAPSSSSPPSSDSSTVGKYQNLVRVVPPAYVDAAALVDMCRRARWTSVGVVYSGLPGAGDPLFDFGEEHVGVETYSAFVNEAARQGIRILASVNVSNYLSASEVVQSPFHSTSYSFINQVNPSSYAADREAALFGEMLNMRRAGVRVVIVLTTKRALCPIMRAAWAAGMLSTGPSDMSYDKVGTGGDFQSVFARIAALRDGRDIATVNPVWDGQPGSPGWVDPFNVNISQTMRALSELNNGSWIQGSDGLYYPPMSTRETFSWVLSSGNMLEQMPVACTAQLPPDYWAYVGAELRGEIGYARPLGREADGNIRRTVFTGYDYFGSRSIGGASLYGAVGALPSWGTPTQQLSLLARSVKRAAKDALYDPATPGSNTATVKTMITDTLFQTGFFADSYAALRTLMRTPALRNALPAVDRAAAAAYLASPSAINPWPADLLNRLVYASMPANTPQDLESLILAARKKVADALLPSSSANPLLDYPSRNDLATLPANAAALRVLNTVAEAFTVTGGPLANSAGNSLSMHQPVKGTKSIYDFPSTVSSIAKRGTAVGDSAVLGTTSQISLPHQVGMAHRGLRALLLSAAGAISDAQSVADPDVIMAFLRGRLPANGLLTQPPLAGDAGGSVPITPGSNDPHAASYDLANRQGPLANTVVRVGSIADRGYVRFLGCPPGSEPDGDFKCRSCPVNSWKSESGSQPCSSCPYAGKTRSRMITRGKVGSTLSSDCLCPVGFYVLPEPIEPSDPGTVCVPCVRAMQCNRVHLLLTQVRNTPGFWRGDATSPYFFPCLKQAHCNMSSTTSLQPLTNNYEATSMNGTTCSGNTEGPLCDTCVQGFGKTANGLCEACPVGGMVYISLALPFVFAILLISVLAATQVGTTPSYVTWRRVNNTKLLISFLQVNAVLLSLNLQWPEAVKNFFNISQLASAVNLSWVAWECVLSSASWPVQVQVFVFYMASPILLLLICTLVIMATGGCGKKVFSSKATASKTLEAAAVTTAVGTKASTQPLAIVDAAAAASSGSSVGALSPRSASHGLRTTSIRKSHWERELEELEAVEKAEKEEEERREKHRKEQLALEDAESGDSEGKEKEKEKEKKKEKKESKDKPSTGGCCACMSRGGKKQKLTDSSPKAGDEPADAAAAGTLAVAGVLADSAAGKGASKKSKAPIVLVVSDTPGRSGEGDDQKAVAPSDVNLTTTATAAAAAADLDRAPVTTVKLPPLMLAPTPTASASSDVKRRSSSVSNSTAGSAADALLLGSASRRDSAISAQSSGRDSHGTSSAHSSQEGSDRPLRGKRASEKAGSLAQKSFKARSEPPALSTRSSLAGSKRASQLHSPSFSPRGASSPWASSSVNKEGNSHSAESGTLATVHTGVTSTAAANALDNGHSLESEEAEVSINDLYKPTAPGAPQTSSGGKGGAVGSSGLEEDFMAVMSSRQRSCGARYAYCIDIMWAVLTIGLFLLYPTLLEVAFTSIDCTFVGPTSFEPNGNNSFALQYNPLVPLNATAAAAAATASTPSSTASSSSLTGLVSGNLTSFNSTATNSSLASSTAVPMIFSSLVPASRDYLRADLSIRCDGQLYNSFLWPIGVAFCALYSVGIPLLFLILVYWNGVRNLHLGASGGGGAGARGGIRIGGEDYLRLAHRLREVASWVKPGKTRTRLYAHFGGPHDPVRARLRAVFDALHSPYSAAQQLQLWKNSQAGGTTTTPVQPQPQAQPQQQVASPRRRIDHNEHRRNSTSGGSVASSVGQFNSSRGSVVSASVLAAGTPLKSSPAGKTAGSVAFSPAAVGARASVSGKPPLPASSLTSSTRSSVVAGAGGVASASVASRGVSLGMYKGKDLPAASRGSRTPSPMKEKEKEKAEEPDETSASSGSSGDEDDSSDTSNTERGGNTSASGGVTSASEAETDKEEDGPRPVVKKADADANATAIVLAPSRKQSLAAAAAGAATPASYRSSSMSLRSASGRVPQLPLVMSPALSMGTHNPLMSRAASFALSTGGGGGRATVAFALASGPGGPTVAALPAKTASTNNAYVSAVGNTSGIGPTGAVFVNIHVRDLSFGLRPVAREDLMSVSLIMQRNVALGALLESAFEEAQMISDENALLLTISAGGSTAEEGDDEEEEGEEAEGEQGRKKCCRAKRVASDASPSHFLGSAGSRLGKSTSHRLVRAWTRDQRESAASIYRRYGAFDVYDEDAGYDYEDEDGANSVGGGTGSSVQSSTGGSVKGRRKPRSRSGSFVGNGGDKSSVASGDQTASDDDEVRSRISDKLTATDGYRKGSFSLSSSSKAGDSTSYQLSKAPGRGILTNSNGYVGGKRPRAGSSSSGGGGGHMGSPALSAFSGSKSKTKSRTKSPKPKAKKGLTRGLSSASMSQAAFKGLNRAGSATSMVSHRSGSKSEEGSSAASEDEDEGGFGDFGEHDGEDDDDDEWPTYPGALYPPGFPVEELQARERRRGKANTDALLALTLLLTADKVEKVGSMQRRFGWLYVDYRPGAFAYEFWSTLRKGMLVAVAVALSERPALLQCIVCIMVLTVYLLVHQHVRPILDIPLMPPQDPDHLIAQHRAAIDGQAMASAMKEGGGAGKGLRSTGERSSLGFGGDDSSDGFFGCGRSGKGGASNKGGIADVAAVDPNSTPLSIGYLGQLHRRLMRNRAALALLQLDPADPLRLGAAIPEAALTPDPPMAELLLSGNTAKVTFDREAGADVSSTALVPFGQPAAGAGAAGGAGSVTAAATGAATSSSSSSSITYEDILLLNPSLLRPYHVACCSARARRLSRNSFPIFAASTASLMGGGASKGGAGGGDGGGSNFCICACPWWTLQLAKLPEFASTARLDRLGVAAQLLGLVLLFIYESQQASQAAGTSVTAGNTYLVSAVLVVNVGVILLVCSVIAVDLWHELKVLIMRLLSSDVFTANIMAGGKAGADKNGSKKGEEGESGGSTERSGMASSGDKDKKGGKQEASQGQHLLPGVAAALATEQAALAAFRRREEALIEQLLAAERALGSSD